MKKLFIVLVFFTSLVKAQDFAPVGATWTFNDQELFGNLNYPRTIVSITDTVVNGIPCHIVIGDCRCGTSATNYLYEINRRVYIYNNATSDFRLLYNFNLNEGDTWNVLAQNTVGDSITLRVDSVTFDTINGNVVKVQHTTPIASYGNYYDFFGPVIEGIGSKVCLYPQASFCDPPTWGLRCYQDSILGFYDTQLAATCDTVFVDSGIGILENEKNIRVDFAPNPLHDEGRIILESGHPVSGVFKLLDATGRLYREEKFTGSNIPVSRKNLEAGIYFYQLIMDHHTASGKIMID